MLANVDKRLLLALLIAVTVIAAVIIVGGVFLAIVKARKRNSPQIMRSIFFTICTAIPSICAKPILDIAILLKDIAKEVIEKLVAIGYDYRGPREDNGNYHLFVLRGPGEISLHHLHCYNQSGKGFEQLVAFRDYMNTHEECAVSYNELKKSLAEKYKENRAVYTLSKAEFIQSVYEKISEEKNTHKPKDLT